MQESLMALEAYGPRFLVPFREWLVGALCFDLLTFVKI